MNGDHHERQPVPLAVVRQGWPVLDARGAPVGSVERVGHGDRDDLIGKPWLLTVREYGPAGRDFMVGPGQIAYVADDHVRLSVTADDPAIGLDPL